MINKLFTGAAVLLAAGSAYSLSFAADLLFGRLFGIFPDTVWLPIGTWSAIFILLLFFAQRLSDKKWTTVLPFALFGCLALFGAVIGSHRHSYWVAGVMFIVTFAEARYGTI